MITRMSSNTHSADSVGDDFDGLNVGAGSDDELEYI